LAKVVVFTEYGPPEVLHVVDVDDPTPAGTELRVGAAGVQPFGASYRRGVFAQYQPAMFPARMGNDAAGVVDAGGAEVTGFAVRDEVITFVDAVGYPDTLVTRTAQTVHKRPTMPWVEAGVLSASGQTADTALDALKITQRDHLLIHAAAGGGGSFAVQLAITRGAGVIGTANKPTMPTCATSAPRR